MSESSLVLLQVACAPSRSSPRIAYCTMAAAAATSLNAGSSMIAKSAFLGSSVSGTSSRARAAGRGRAPRQVGEEGSDGSTDGARWS